MKITRTELRAMPVQVEDEIVEIATGPGWLLESFLENCDCCKFPIARSERLSALRLSSGKYMFIHSDCLTRLTK